jgi:lysophospholipase L1-like esterase
MIPGIGGGGSSTPGPDTLTNLYAWYKAGSGMYDATSGGSLVTTNRGQIARWEDQSGNGRHITQATAANRMVWDATNQCVVSESYDGPDHHFTFPASFTLNRRAFTCIAIIDWFSYYASLAGSQGCANNIFAAGTADGLNLYTTGTGRLVAYDGTTARTPVASVPTVTRCMAAWVGGASNFKSALNNTIASTTLLAAGSVDMLTLGRVGSLPNGTILGAIKDVIFYDREVTDSELQTTLWTYAQSRGAEAVTAKQVICVGDSITQGYGATLRNSWPNLLAASISNTVRVCARSGRTLTQLETDRAASLTPLIASGDVCVVFGGTNDLASADAATTEARLNTLCTGLRGSGAKVVVVKSLPRSGRDIAGLNTLIDANWTTYADELVDPYADARMNPVTSTYYFETPPSSVHPNDAGYAVLHELILPKVQSQL